MDVADMRGKGAALRMLNAFVRAHLAHHADLDALGIALGIPFEVQFVALRNIELIAQRYPAL